MKRLLSILLLLAAANQVTADDRADGIEFFEKKIRPVLVKSCYQCHSSTAANVKGGLRLDSAAALSAGGDSGAAVVAGKPDESLLLDALRFDGLKMPPSGKLPDAVIAEFEKWIALGAPFPKGNPVPLDNQQPARRNHWAYQPLQKAAIPPTDDTGWSWTDIDRFIFDRLADSSHQPPADADPHTLVRRIHFDVTGLPPSSVEIRQFVEQEKQDHRAAIAELVDRLLASPQFGEKWARHWLDLARYSESNGGDRNVVWPHAWRYRNWVIDALNDDKPYDQFVREQVAGDLMQAATSDEKDRQRVATGFLTLGPKLFMETKSERFRMDRVDEQIDVVTRSVLGLTVSCARCHDHKFDPIPTHDYYALAGIFRSTYLLSGTAAPAGNQYGHDRPLQPIGKDADKLEGPAQAWKKDVADQTSARNKARSDRYRVVRSKAADENKLKMLQQAKGYEQKIAALIAKIEKQAAEIKVWDDTIKAMDAELKQLTDNPPQLPDYAMAVRDDEQPADCRICIRGEFNKLGDNTPRGMLTLLPDVPVAEIQPTESGRLQLAAWLTDAKNSLTPRVAVNRIWQQLLGEGIVSSPDNFGLLGERPTHPELLDHLAIQFQQDGWSVKRAIRRIVTSRTYQLSTQQTEDVAAEHGGLLPTARLLPAESLRDAILSVSGQLNLERPSASMVATVKDPEFNDRVKLTPEQLEHRHRAIYLPVVRNGLPRMLAKFDFADPSLLIARRGRRIMLSQQLYLMNNPFIIQQSELAARRMLSDVDDDDRVATTYLRFFGRLPDDSERRQTLEFLDEIRDQAADKESESTEIAAWSALCQALFASAEFRYLY